MGTPLFTLGNQGLLLLQLNLAIASVALSVMVARAVRRFNLLMFWIFVYLFAALAPISQIQSKSFAWPGIYSEDEVFSAAALVGLGVLSWCAGYWIVTSMGMRQRQRMITVPRLNRLGWVGLVLTGLVGATAGLASVLGGRGGLDSQTNLGDLSSPIGILVRGTALVPIVLALVGLLTVREPRSFRPLGSRVLIVLLALAVLIVANPVGNARYTFGAVAIAVAVAVFGHRGHRQVKLLNVTLLVGLILIFPIADSFRYSTEEIQSVELNSGVLASGDYDAFQQTMNGMRYVDGQGARGGQQALGALFVAVPRSIWTEKPEPTGVVIASSSGYRFTNLSSPIWIEGYLDFRHFGTALLSVLFGSAAAVLDRRFLRSPGSMLGILSPIVAGYQTILLRGALMGVSAFLLMWIAMAFVISSKAICEPKEQAELAG